LNREAKIDFIAGQVVTALTKMFSPVERDFALEEVIRVARAIRSRSKSSRYKLEQLEHLDFAIDEPPTEPGVTIPDLGERETRAVRISEIADAIARSKKDAP
jgi:hypothetical protein